MAIGFLVAFFPAVLWNNLKNNLSAKIVASHALLLFTKRPRIHGGSTDSIFETEKLKVRKKIVPTGIEDCSK